jgi:ribosomal-protein-alanine acetyltransferase
LKIEDFVNIRPATVADVSLMIALERQCDTAAHWTEQQYRSLFQLSFRPALFGPGETRAERLILVTEDSLPLITAERRADANQGILGFLIAHHVSPEWELENIVVAPAARRKGHGKRLLDALLRAARETNSEAVFLEVRESNSAARALYEKADFLLTGRRKAYYTDPPEDAIRYHLRLN